MRMKGRASAGLLVMLLCAHVAGLPRLPASNDTDPTMTLVEEFWWEVQMEIMSIVAELQTQCPEEAFSCLRNGSLVQHTAEESGFIGLCSLCRCDPDCLMYGDCCADYAATAAVSVSQSAGKALLDTGHPQLHGVDALRDVIAINVNAILSAHLNEVDMDRPTFVCSTLNFQRAGLYMVGSCPKKFSEVNMKQLCQRQVSGAAYTYLVDMPVTSAATNLTYVNFFCAVCHADAHSLYPWNISIQCRGLSEGTLMQEFMRTAEYQAGLRMWHHTALTHDGRPKKTICLLRVKEFSSVAAFISQFGGRQCLEPKPFCTIGDSSYKCSSQVRECAESWTDKRVKEKCEQYSMIMLHGRVVYKNPHCALCNGVNFTDIMPQYKPQYNSGSLCWINNRDSLILFFLMPIGVIILENVALFIVTSYGIYQQSKYSKFAKMRSQSIKKHENRNVPKESRISDDHKNRAERKDRIRFLLYIKLGIIQGLTWTTGFLAAITGLPACWYLFTVLNGLQGFFIFLSFDMKKKVWLSVHEKLTWKLWTLRSSTGTSTTTFTTGTSSARRFQSNEGDAVCTETTQLDDDLVEMNSFDNTRKFLTYPKDLKRVARSAKTLFSKSELNQLVSCGYKRVERPVRQRKAIADDATHVIETTRPSVPVVRSLQSSKNPKTSGSSDPALQVEDDKGKQSEKIINFHQQESRAVISDKKTNVEIIDKNSSISDQTAGQGTKSLDKSLKKSFEIEKMKDFLKHVSRDKPFVKRNRSASDIRQENVNDMKSLNSNSTQLKRTCSSRDYRISSSADHAVKPHGDPQPGLDLHTPYQDATAPKLNNRRLEQHICNDAKQLKSEPKLIHRMKNQCRIQDHL
ncbi:GPCR family 2 secretin-like [Trinorchestia longiramus]|nr:GPCR family 2 secretin-like [Trinorchestia longiramus]